MYGLAYVLIPGFDSLQSELDRTLARGRRRLPGRCRLGGACRAD
jgi:hypothetical protein